VEELRRNGQRVATPRTTRAVLLGLWNEPSYIEFIRDWGVRTVEQAEARCASGCWPATRATAGLYGNAEGHWRTAGHVWPHPAPG
jgi:hypothetical protein